MKDEYIIVNKTAILKRLEYLTSRDNLITPYLEWVYEKGERYALNQVLSQSIPLIPEIEKAFDSGCAYTVGSHKDMVQIHPDKQEYINSLKLEI